MFKESFYKKTTPYVFLITDQSVGEGEPLLKGLSGLKTKQAADDYNYAIAA